MDRLDKILVSQNMGSRKEVQKLFEKIRKKVLTKASKYDKVNKLHSGTLESLEECTLRIKQCKRNKHQRKGNPCQ